MKHYFVSTKVNYVNYVNSRFAIDLGRDWRMKSAINFAIGTVHSTLKYAQLGPNSLR